MVSHIRMKHEIMESSSREYNAHTLEYIVCTGWLIKEDYDYSLSQMLSIVDTSTVFTLCDY